MPRSLLGSDFAVSGAAMSARRWTAAIVALTTGVGRKVEAAESRRGATSVTWRRNATAALHPPDASPAQPRQAPPTTPRALSLPQPSSRALSGEPSSVPAPSRRRTPPLPAHILTVLWISAYYPSPAPFRACGRGHLGLPAAKPRCWGPGPSATASKPGRGAWQPDSSTLPIPAAGHLLVSEPAPPRG